MSFLFKVLFTNDTTGELEITAESLAEAQKKMSDNHCVADYWLDSQCPDFVQTDYWTTARRHQEAK